MAPLAVVKISTHSLTAALAWHVFRNAADPHIGWSGLLNKVGYNLKRRAVISSRLTNGSRHRNSFLLQSGQWTTNVKGTQMALRVLPYHA